MALRTPFEFDQDPATHPLGEKIVSVADPIETAPGAHTYYLARRFDLVDGNYTIEIDADDAATVWIGTAQLNIRLVASATFGKPALAALYIPQGSYRLDVILQNLPPTPSPCFFTMIIKRGEEVIYTSAKDGWLLDDQPISDDDLPPGDDYRFKLPVFSVRPNWKQGIVERLSWLTDVMESETDAEQRRSVRRNARRSFEANFLRERTQRDRLDTFFVGVGPAQFMLPLWHESVELTEGLSMEASGVTFPDGEFRLREFRKGDLVFVNAGDPDDWDILQVGDTETNRFSWAFPPPRAWAPGTRIYPMRVAKIVESSPKMSNITDTVATSTVRFDLVEPYTVTASWGGSINGEPLFRFSPNWKQSVDVDYTRKSFTLDNQSGVPITTDHGRFTTAQVQLKLGLIGRHEAFAFRQFLQSARGQAKHFYMPTFTQDIYPFGDIPADTIDLHIREQGYFQYMSRPQPLRLQLAFQFRNGSPTIYRLIKDVQPVYLTDPDGSLSTPLRIGSELLTLDEPMPAVALNELKRISFIVETRFAQDAFELFHPTNGQEFVETSLVFKQAQNPRIIP